MAIFATYEKSVVLNSPLTLINSVLSRWAHCTVGDTLQHDENQKNYSFFVHIVACIDRY